MEAFAEQRSGHTVAINWPLWLEGGMNIEDSALKALEQRTGLSAITSQTGIGAFHHSLLTGNRRTMLLEGKADVLRSIIKVKTPVAKSKPVVVKSNVAKPDVIKSDATSGNVVEQTRDLLRQQFSSLLKMPAERIDVNAQMENYGIDSILAMNLTGILEKTFGPLPKTLFFEYLTVADLADYLVQSHSDKLATLFAKDEPQQAVATTAPAKPARAIQRPARQRVLPQAQAANEIAIIGLSGRYPESKDIDAYWGNLADGKDCVTEVPESRWSWQQWYSEDRTEPEKHYSKWGGFIAGVDEFDPRFFNISPKEATTIDPQERLFLQQVWLAVEDAGYTRNSLQIPRQNDQSGQVGVYAGVMYGEYHRSGSLASVANRASYVLNIHGPSMTVDTMCSSSLTAIHLACQDLKSGRTDVGIAGGVNVSVHPGKYLMLSSGQFISSDGHCQSFGVGGDGYIPGEGVGIVVLRRLQDAEKDGQHIYGVIKGSSLNHGGKTNGYTVPNPQAQASAITGAITEAKVDPRHISYIEAHGTGTKLGDPIEITALSKAFYQNVEGEKATGFCLIGSAKSNVGHCESAAGIAGVTKVLLQMKHQQVVPSLHSKELNPHIDFDQTPFIVNQTLTDWQQPVINGKTVPRLAGISSFGAGGANAHVIIEEYAAKPKAQVSGPVAIVLSARTAKQLEQKAQDLLSFVQSQQNLSLAAMAYTLQIGREAMDERAAFVADSIEAVQSQLANFSNVNKGSIKRASNIPASPEVKQNNLTALVAAWLAGSEIDWASPYPQNQGFISLPGYPFAQDKYWHMPELPEQKLSQQAEPSIAVKANINPLLQSNLSDLNGLRFVSTFNGKESFLSDGYLPDLLVLEMIRLAAEQVNTADNKALQIRHLLWGAPVQIDGETQVEVAVLPDGSVEVFSGEIIHAQAVTEFAAIDKPVAVNISGLQAVKGEQWLFGAVEKAVRQYSVLSAEQITVYGSDFETLYIQIQDLNSSLNITVYSELGQAVAQIKGLAYQVIESQSAEQIQVADTQAQPIDVEPVVEIVKKQPESTVITLPAVVIGNESIEVGSLVKPDNIQLSKPEAFLASDSGLSGKPKWNLPKTAVETGAKQAPANIHLVAQGTGVVDIELIGDKADSELTIASLNAAFARIEQLENVKVVQLHGVLLDIDRETCNQAIEQGLFATVAHCRYPVIHILQDDAYGANALLAACCDFIVLHDQAKYSFELAVGPTEQAFFSERFGRVQTREWLFAANADIAAALNAKSWMLNVSEDPQKAAADLCDQLVEKSQTALTVLKPHLSRFLTDLVDDLSPYQTHSAKQTETVKLWQTAAKNISVYVAEGNIAQITFEPGKTAYGNAPLLKEFSKVMAELPKDIKAVVLASNLLNFTTNAKQMPTQAQVDGFRELIQNCSVPVIAAVERNARQFGFFLALCCDDIVMGYNCEFGFGESALESAIGPWATRLLTERLGTTLGAQVGYSHEYYNGKELAELACSLKVVAPDKVIETTKEVAGQWAVRGGSIKMAINQRLSRDLPQWPKFSADKTDETAIVLKTDVVKAELKKDGIVVVSLEERQAKNMFTEALALGLREAIEAINKHSGCKVVVLTGFDSYFASGGTLDTLLAIQNGTAQFTDEKTFQLPMDCQLPVIAAMQGHGLGGGWSFGMFADCYIYSEESHFVSPYMTYGFTPGAGSTLVFPKRLEIGRAHV